MKPRPRALLTLLACGLVAWSSPALGATELRRVDTTIEVGDTAVAIDHLVTLAGYVEGETLTVTLEYGARCNLVFGGLAVRAQNGFTPRVAAGTLERASGRPAAGAPAAAGSVTFDLTFDALKRSGKSKALGTAHLTLLLGVDQDCDPATGDADGVDLRLSVPVKISVSTAGPS